MAIILIVDDRKINRAYLCALLKHFNHEIIEANNGHEALDSLKELTPDLIISDIYMPVMDGYEFVRRLRKDHDASAIPVIFYTANYREEEADALKEALHIHSIITKPCEPQRVIEAINVALDDKKNKEILNESTINFHKGQKLSPSLYRMPQRLIDFENEFQQKVGGITHQQLTEFSYENMMDLAEDLSQGLKLYKKVSTRLFTLIELHLDMLEEQDPQKLLDLFCLAANKIIDTEFTFAGIFNNQGKIKYIASSNIKPGSLAFDSNMLTSSHPFIAEIFKKGTAFFYNEIDNDKLNIPFFVNPPKRILGVGLLTAKRTYGFAYFLNKKNDLHFSEEDSQIINTLSAGLSLLYENRTTYLRLAQQTQKLRLESTRLKIAKNNLHKSETLFRQFAENIKDIFWRTSADLNELVYVSPAYEEIWGTSSESLALNPHSWQDCVLNEDQPIIKAHVDKIIQQQKGGHVQYRIKRLDGTIRYIYNKSFCLKDKNGKLVNVIGVASDITEYFYHQQNILLEQNLRRIFDERASFKNVAPKLLQFVCNLFQWEVGEIWLIDEQSNVLRNIMTWQKKLKDAEKNKISHIKKTYALKEGFVGKIWQQSTPLHVENIGMNPIFKGHPLPKSHHLEDALGFPLIYNEKVVGVMVFLSHRIIYPAKEFTSILDMLGARVAEFIYQKYSQEKLLQFAKRDIVQMLF